MSKTRRPETPRNREQYILLQSMAGHKDKDNESDAGYCTLKGKVEIL